MEFGLRFLRHCRRVSAVQVHSFTHYFLFFRDLSVSSAETPMEVFENIANWETLLPDIIEQHLDIFSPELLNLILGCA